MSRTPNSRGTKPQWRVLAALAGLVLLSGCAVTPVGSVSTARPGLMPADGAINPTPVLIAPVPTATSATPDPTPTPTPTPTPKPTPVDPFAALSAKAKKEFKGCLKTTVRPGSGGRCARLVVKKLRAAGFYRWGATASMNTAAVNALLNYQRSRGIKSTGTTTTATWVALATKARQVPLALPSKCTRTKGIVLCVDQAHRKLFWIKNGKVVKTFKVRLGGWNFYPKTKKWKVFATANGTWRVYDKQVNPESENYGSGAMPYSTMFYPDMYVHYSPGFASTGYANSSHGCVNIGNLSQAQWI
ncbi:MAG: L,D-transpeptidase, partial [Propionicimonas sp.]